MASVENRVVSMEFNNSSFEQKISTTLRSLQKLSSSLAFPNAKDGFADLDKAAGDVKLDGMTSAIENVSGKFIALSTIAITALSNITNKAIDAGSAIVKALTITPLIDGFAEYELKMGSIQTIMAGTGESLETVNGYLNDLNAYSDRTIYSFADMTANIGKFTNAGVSLKDSVAAIQGVANVAALSGANSQQASNAMYNFAQALATGSVKLIDWKSIENAGLATVQFKESLLEGAVAAGTLTKEADGMYATLEGVPVDSMKNFNSTLQEGWLDAETLTTTLGTYSDTTTEVGKKASAAATDVKTFSQAIDTIKEAAGSGWAASFEIAFGDFEEGKELWTEFSEAVGGVIGNSAEMRNSVLQDWKDLGGRSIAIEGIRDVVRGLASVIEPVRDAFRSMFPRKTGQDLLELTKKFAAFAKSIAISEGTADKIRRIFTGLFAALKIGVEVVKGVFGVFTSLFSLFAGGSGGALTETLAKTGDGVVKLQEALVEGGGIADFFDKITKSISEFASTARRGFTQAKDAIVSFFSAIDFQPIVDAFATLKNAISDLFSRDVEIPSGVKSSFSAFGKVIQAIANAFGKFLSGLAAIGGAIGKVAGFIATAVGKIVDVVKNIGSAIGESLSGADFENTGKVVGAGLFAGLLAVLTGFLKNGLKLDFGQFGVFDELERSLGAVTGSLKAMQTNVKADTLMKIAISLGVLTASILVLSMIDGGDIAKAMTALTVGLVQLGTALYALEQMGGGAASAAKLILISIGITILAGAVLLLALAMKVLGTMDADEMAVGLVAITGLLIGLSKAVKPLTENTDGMIKAGIGLMFIAAALIVMALALKLMSMIEPAEMIRGFAGIAVALALLVTAVNALDATDMIKAGVGMFAIAIALIVMAGAIKIMAMLDTETMVRGFTGIAVALGIMVVAMNKMDARQILSVSAGILIVSVALNLMVKAVKDMSALGWGAMTRGVAGLSLTMLLLGVAMNAVKTGIKGAVALFIIAKALGSLTDVLREIGSIPIPTIIIGLLALAGMFAVLGGAGAIIGPVVPILLAFGAAVFLIGAGLGLLGLGAYYVAKAIQVLANVGEKGVKLFLSVLDDLLKALPGVGKELGKAAIAFAKSFLEGTPELIGAAKELIGALLSTLRELIPDIIETGVLLLVNFLQGLREVFPEIVETGYAMFMALLQGISDNIFEIVSTVGNIIIEFVKALGSYYVELIAAGAELIGNVIKGFGEAAEDIVDAGADAIISFVEGMASNVLKVIDAGFQIVIDFLNGLADSIRQNRGELASAGLNVIDAVFGGMTGFFTGTVVPWVTGIPDAILGFLGDAFGKLKDWGRDVINGLKDGAVNALILVGVWFRGIPGKILTWIGSGISMLYTVGKDVIQGLMNGIGSMASALWNYVWNFVKENVKGALLSFFNINSPSRTMMPIGSGVVEGLIIGMGQMETPLKRASKTMGETVVDGFAVDENELTEPIRNAVQLTVDAINELDLVDSNPTITPVLDLTGVKKDAKSLGAMLSYGQAIDISATDSANRAAAAEAQQAATTGEIKFEQNNYSPKELSTNDIYRRTRSQIALAKEELSIQ